MKLLENMRIFALVQNLFNVVGAHTGEWGCPPLVFWEILNFLKHVQNVDNVLRYNR